VLEAPISSGYSARLIAEAERRFPGVPIMEIYPIRGETSEGQMMVYFPEHKLLYGSDVFQKLPDGKYFYDQTISEVAAAVEREHLAVETFFMMHMGLTPWQDALKELQTAQ
jgi:hypothetical protein